MYNFKIDLNLFNTFFNQTYNLAVFNGERSKVILFLKINPFLRSTTQSSIRTDLIKKINYNYITRFKFCFVAPPQVGRRPSVSPALTLWGTPWKT